MTLTRRHKIAAAALLALAAGGGALYWQYNKLAAAVKEGLAGKAGARLGRQIRTGEVAFSLFEGVTIKDACVSRKPDFTKGEFFCAARVVIHPDLAALLRNKLYFSSVSLEKPRIKVREKNGVWDFSDLLALLPETDKGLHLTWNTRELALTGALVEADLESSGHSLALEDAAINLSHHSTFGGNFGFKASGTLKTVLNGKLLSTGVQLESESNYAYGGLSSSKGEARLLETEYGALSLRELELNWELFNLRKPLTEKNYSVSLEAGGLLVPAQDGPVRDQVSRALEMFSSAMGRPAPRIEDLEVSSLKAAFRLDDNLLAVKDISLRANFMDLDAGLEINGPAKTAEAGLEAAIGPNRIKMSASGPMAAPEIKPALSQTLSNKFRESLRNIQGYLLRNFPVTGE